jgi:hypothetical protein
MAKNGFRSFPQVTATDVVNGGTMSWVRPSPTLRLVGMLSTATSPFEKDLIVEYAQTYLETLGDDAPTIEHLDVFENTVPDAMIMKDPRKQRGPKT